MAGTTNYEDLQVIRITLTENSTLTPDGLLGDAIAVVYEKQFAPIFSESNNLLSELVEDVSTEVVFHDDPEWKMFPEVQRALTRAGAEENCYCIAVHQSTGKWAVGIAGAWKTRAAATRVALCLALADENSTLREVCLSYPEFSEYYNPGSGEAVAAKFNESLSSRKKSKASAAEKPRAPAIPRNDKTVFWICLVVRSEVTRGRMPSDGPVVVHGKEDYRELFSHAQSLLLELVRVVAEVDLKHDADWDIYPEVGKAITDAGGEQSCYCVASCRSKERWAVGVGASWKAREAAAKLAMCVSLVSNSPRSLDRLAPRYPTFGMLCEEAGMLPASKAKRRRF